MSAQCVRWLALGVLLSGTIVRVGAAQESGLAVGARAPDAAVETLDGQPTELARFLGEKPVLLEFWATWCPLCKQLEPAMHAVRARFAGRITFVNIGITPNQTPEKQRRYAADKGIVGEFVYDRGDKAVAAYQVRTPSSIVIIDRSGTIGYSGSGGTQPVDSLIAQVVSE